MSNKSFKSFLNELSRNEEITSISQTDSINNYLEKLDEHDEIVCNRYKIDDYIHIEYACRSELAELHKALDNAFSIKNKEICGRFDKVHNIIHFDEIDYNKLIKKLEYSVNLSNEQKKKFDVFKKIHKQTEKLKCAEDEFSGDYYDMREVRRDALVELFDNNLISYFEETFYSCIVDE